MHKTDSQILLPVAVASDAPCSGTGIAIDSLAASSRRGDVVTFPRLMFFLVAVRRRIISFRPCLSTRMMTFINEHIISVKTMTIYIQMYGSNKSSTRIFFSAYNVRLKCRADRRRPELLTEITCSYARALA